ncbi:MAG TPA: hypothetical protein VME23_13420 [Terracidiphilus sp.]|nr:hypothetical protein [Terracidiphilus sp.]
MKELKGYRTFSIGPFKARNQIGSLAYTGFSMVIVKEDGSPVCTPFFAWQKDIGARAKANPMPASLRINTSPGSILFPEIIALDAFIAVWTSSFAAVNSSGTGRASWKSGL